MFQVDRRIFTHFDYIVPILILPIIGISFFLVYELYPVLANKQLIYFVAGLILFTFFFFFPIRKFSWLIPFFYWSNVLLLLSVKIFGVSRLGAQRWLEIPFMNFTLQPSELMKPTMILMLAYFIKNNPPDTDKGYGIVDFLKLSVYILIPFLLILKQPDLGTALILFFIGYGILFIIGVNNKIWLSILVLTAFFAPLVYNNIHDYQKKRIADFLAEKPSYHVRQSIIAIGSGGISGKSEDEATQSHMKFLPIATSDFIFAFYMERFGFWGGLALIMVYALLILHFLMITLYMKGDYFAQVLSSSLALMFFLYTGVNIAMTIGYAPVVGLPLPLFSYGGSSFITFIILIAIFENLVAFRFNKFNDVVRYER
ncbi:MAG TPA: rod shape-determining protein RodA [Campylobacterales bacterium]|nr:rod shape-determining protein RodA [Campylobacterales bacterium]